MSISQILELIKLGRAIGEALLDVARLIHQAKAEEAAEESRKAAEARSHGTAAGISAYNASRKAGHK